MNSNRELRRIAWEEYIRKGTITNGIIRPEIVESWRDCLTAGLDPYGEPLSYDLNESEKKALLQENELLVRTARPFLEGLLKSKKDLDMTVFITDRSGFILDAFGAGTVWKACQEKKGIIGGSFGEQRSGNCAPYMALRLDRPCLVLGEEHYLQTSHMFDCAASPVHDEFDRVIGCLDITWNAKKSVEQTHALGMIIAASRFIENQVCLLKDPQNAQVLTQYLSPAMETMPDGLIILNLKNQITYMNRTAKRFLNIDSNPLHKSSLWTIDGNREVPGAPVDQKPVRNYEIIVDELAKQNHYMVTRNVIMGQNFQEIGRLLVIRERKEFQERTKKAVELNARYTFSDIWGESDQIKETIALAKRVTNTDANVVILGESGTGKEMIAQSIHNAGLFASGPFLAINCAAIPRDLVESELFGYEAGSFTGALKAGRPGQFELANGGTLFLDEVSDMPLDMQSKLLRVLEEKRIQRLGGKRYIPIQVRLIAATNKNLEEEVEKGNFRSDLFYRLNVIEISIPPLRERGSDIELLIQKFIEEISQRLKKGVAGISPEAMAYLKNQSWTGNVRQLRNWVERAVSLTESSILTVADFPRKAISGKSEQALQSRAAVEEAAHPGTSLTEVETEMIQTVLEEYDGNISLASKKLGISRNTLYRKMQRYQINRTVPVLAQ
ncbi:MAG: sigma-54-dependent Fis family transcriptional regulator [Smithellaceae bacterium]